MVFSHVGRFRTDVNILFRSFKNRGKTLIIAGLLSASLAGAPQSAGADSVSPAVATMYSIMSAMANFMAMMMSGNNSMYPGAFGLPGGMPYGQSPYSALGSGLWPMTQNPGFGSGMGSIPGLSPFDQSPFNQPFSQGLGNNSQGLSQFFNQSQTPFNNNQSYTQGPASPGNFWLNGQWQAQTGETLQIRGKDFRLVSRQGALNGFATSNGELLNLYVPQLNQTLLFQVQLQGDAMILRESGGMVLNFRKTGN